jgi:cbb3-type cytochrome oxidase subunit 3
VETDQGKFRRAALWFTVTMIIILIGIPWWRPLLRF